MFVYTICVNNTLGIYCNNWIHTACICNFINGSLCEHSSTKILVEELPLIIYIFYLALAVLKLWYWKKYWKACFLSTFMYIQFIDFIEDHSISNIIHHITKEAKSIAENHEKICRILLGPNDRVMQTLDSSYKWYD